MAKQSRENYAEKIRAEEKRKEEILREVSGSFPCILSLCISLFFLVGRGSHRRRKREGRKRGCDFMSTDVLQHHISYDGIHNSSSGTTQVRRMEREEKRAIAKLARANSLQQQVTTFILLITSTHSVSLAHVCCSVTHLNFFLAFPFHCFTHTLFHSLTHSFIYSLCWIAMSVITSSRPPLIAQAYMQLEEALGGRAQQK